MTNLLSSWVLFFSVLGLTAVEKKYSKNLFTPFMVTAWPYAIISVLVNLFAVQLDFLPVTARVNFFVLLNLSLIWLIGMMMYQSYGIPREKTDFAAIFSRYREFRYFLLSLSWIVILAVTYKVFSILRKEGLLYVSTGEFEDKMVSGLTAHLGQVGAIVLVLYVLSLWNFRKTYFDYLTMLSLGITITAMMVKYPIVWTVLTIFFIKNLNSSVKLQVRKLFYIAGFIILIFVVNFLILYTAWSDFGLTSAAMWKRIWGWFINYLCSGPIMLDKWIDYAHSKPWWSLFVVPINFTNVIIGDPERLNAVKFVSPGFLSVAPGFKSNVGTSFGVYYMIGGFWFTILTTVIIGLLSYYFYLKSFRSSNPIVAYLAAVFLIMGILSFFVQYFTLLTPYYLLVLFSLFVGMFEIILAFKRS